MYEEILNFFKGQIALLILIPIIVPIIIFLCNSYLTELFAKREKKGRRELWINFFHKYDTYIHDCILQYGDIEKPKGNFSLLCPTFGFVSGYFAPPIFSYILLHYSIDNLDSIVVSMFLFFGIGVVLTEYINNYIDDIKKKEEFLEKSKFAIDIITFIKWFTFSSSTIAILFIYILYLNLDKILNSELLIYLLAPTFLFWLIIMIYPSISRRDLLNYSKKVLNLKYFEKFPYLYIKTTSEDLEGKICDVFDKNFIILDNNGDKRATEWHSVTSLKLRKRN